MDWITLLLLLHIAGAIIGFGPAFSFAILGPLAGKLGGPQALGILKGMAKIEKTLIVPMIVIQPLTGTFLIFKEGLNHGFFEHYWLWLSILVFAAAVAIALIIQNPAVEQLVELAEEGKGGTPEFGATAKRTQTFGPVLTILLVIIIVLMVTKPGP
ncbi:MAG TPA: DUF2269 family protein [Actinomycetota bacterium]|nr:DUF2269 family protein [Actinomycetota bacterium]